MVLVVLSMTISAGKAQLFIIGDVTQPSIGAMINFQCMDPEQLGFYNYGTYGNSNKPGMEFNSIALGAGLSYYWSVNDDPQECVRVYSGFNYNVWWQGDELLFPGKTISFDIGVSKTLGRFTVIIMWDPLNHSVKPGISYYF